MANKNDPICEIDAQKVLATLHSAAKEAIKAPSTAFVLNSGIENDENITPADVIKSKMLFNLNNSNGLYEIAIAETGKFEYQPQLKYENMDEISKLKEKDKEEKESKSLTTPSTTPSKYEKQIYDIYSNIIKGFSADESKPFKENEKAFIEAIQGENEKRLNEMKTSIEKIHSDTFKLLQTYFETFAGRENAAKIRKSDTHLMFCGAIPPNEDLNNYFESKDFKIVPDTDKLNETSKEETKKHLTDGKKLNGLCILIASYNIETETM